MRILLHDYAGHPYAVQLSRALARKGHEVLHVYSASNPMPQGTLALSDEDPKGFQVRAISLSEKIDKANLLKRRGQEVAHGVQVGKVIREFTPDFVMSGCAPLDTQNHIWQVCNAVKCKNIFWLQDLTGFATEAVLRNKIPIAGSVIGRYYTRLEERLLRESATVIAISKDFLETLGNIGMSAAKTFVIENWGPIDELPVLQKDNDWSRRNGLSQTFNFIYSGTLGMKHDPNLLVELAKTFRSDKTVRVVVTSEGIGRRWLEKEKESQNLDNLVLFDFQPFNEVPQVMATADVLTAILEPSAGIFSVPSKVLSYLCSGRPLLLAVPPENLAARIVDESKSGLTAQPKDIRGYLANARRLFVDADLRAKMGVSGRAYAEQAFDIDSIADRFVEVFSTCAAK